MHINTIIKFLLLVFVVFNCQFVAAQNKKKRHEESERRDIERLGIYFTFPNLSTVPFYYDEKKLKNIQGLEKQGDLLRLEAALSDYVQNFGIQNFSHNTEMLWKLGQLCDKLQYHEKALFIYRIALKHVKAANAEHIHKYYDSVTVEEEAYVPLEYYYDLVEYRRSVDTLVPPVNVLLNMGELVNDKKYPDYGPTMDVNGKTLFYTKRKKEIDPVKVGFRENEDLYMSKNYDGFWDEATPFPSVINSRCNEGSACLSKDGKRMFFARCKVADYQYDCRTCIGSCDIYYTEFIDSAWTDPVNLGPNVNTIYWDSHPTLSHTEDTLFFASDRLGGFGLSDIWYTYKTANGTWAKAQNMGPTINTSSNDLSPFFHPIHKVLYFSSNGQLMNFGEVDPSQKRILTYDIYKSRNIAQNFWDEPRNVGPLVNGKGDEYYFTIDAEAKNLYYAKSEIDNIENLDLFSFPVPMEAKATAYTKLTGSLKDSLTEDPFKGIVSIIDLTNGVEVAPKYMREDGSFEFDLIPQNDYLLVLQGDDFFRVEHQFRLNADTSIHLKTNSIKYNKWKFNSLEFDNNSSKIKPEMEADLNKVVDFLLDHPYLKIQISGHTDSDGDPAANLKLSKDRAQAIKDYVVSKGQFDPDRVIAEGYGNTKPIVEEKTNEDKKINRRVEFEIIKLTPKEIEQIREEEKAKRKENSEDELFNYNEEEKPSEEKTEEGK
jgi:hypothetical protein